MTDAQPPGDPPPEVLSPGKAPTGSQYDEPLGRIVRNSFDVVGLIALGNLVVANYKPGQDVDIAKIISETSKSGLEVFRNSAGPAIHAYNSEFLKLSAISEHSRISESPLYLRLSQDQVSATSTVASQIRDLEGLLRTRTNYYTQIAVGVLASIVLGIFVLIAQKIAPTTVFYGLNNAQPTQTASHGH